MKDLETIEKLKNISEVFKKLKENLLSGNLIKDIALSDKEKAEIEEYQFLTSKPIIYLLNINENQPLDKEKFK